jgi:MFS family permease
LLAQSIAQVVGGASLTTWLTLSIIIYVIVLGPSSAQAADLFGRKWIIVVGSVTGMVGCIITSRANSIGMAIAGQAVSGIAQITQGVTTALLSEILPRKYRPVAQGVIITSIGAASIVALYVGGAMCKTQATGFRNFFYFNAAIFAATAILFAIFYNPPPREVQKLSIQTRLRQFDFGGTLLTLVAFLGISIALGLSQNPYTWRNARVLVPFVVGICGFFSLVLVSVAIQLWTIVSADDFQLRLELPFLTYNLVCGLHQKGRHIPS